MKKIITVLLIIILLTGCNSKDNCVTDNLIKYSKGNIISCTNNELIVENTTKEDLNNYIKALETITYSYVDNYENTNPYYMTNKDNYLKLEYKDSKVTIIMSDSLENLQ